MTRSPGIACLLTLATAPAQATLITFDGTMFPEETGFERVGTFDADRWLQDGWFHQHVELGVWEPPLGEQDFYRRDLSEYAGHPFFIEWRTTTDAPPSEIIGNNGGVIMALAGGPVTYHFNMANGLAKISRGVQYPILHFEIESDVPHTYRLEVDRDAYFAFSIDGTVVDSGLPEADWPTQSALMSFGTRYWEAENTTGWDYVTFGSIPEASTAALLAVGAMLARWRRRR